MSEASIQLASFDVNKDEKRRMTSFMLTNVKKRQKTSFCTCQVIWRQLRRKMTRVVMFTNVNMTSCVMRLASCYLVNKYELTSIGIKTFKWRKTFTLLQKKWNGSNFLVLAYFSFFLAYIILVPVNITVFICFHLNKSRLC